MEQGRHTAVFSIRQRTPDSTPYFVGKDVAEVLDYNEPHKAVVRHVDEEDRKILTTQNYQNGTFEIPNRGMTIINESGLYSLIQS